jgi:hypothetical protein
MLHLLGPHIVHTHNEAFWEFIQKLQQFEKVVSLPRGLVLPAHDAGSRIAGDYQFKDKNKVYHTAATFG